MHPTSGNTSGILTFRVDGLLSPADIRSPIIPYGGDVLPCRPSSSGRLDAAFHDVANFAMTELSEVRYRLPAFVLAPVANQ